MASQQLHCAAREGWLPRMLRPRRLFSLLALVAALVVAYMHRGDVAQGWNRLRYYGAQKACLECQHPPTQVAVEMVDLDQPDKAGAGAYIRTPLTAFWRPRIANGASLAPQYAAQDVPEHLGYRFLQEPLLSRLDAFTPNPFVLTVPSPPSATLFLHERRTRGGLRRLVLIQCFEGLRYRQSAWGGPIPYMAFLEFRAAILAPSRFGRPAKWKIQPFVPPVWVKPHTMRFRFDVGLPDATDASMFHIHGVEFDKDFSIDGALVDDGSDDTSVTITTVYPPRAAPTWLFGEFDYPPPPDY